MANNIESRSLVVVESQLYVFKRIAGKKCHLDCIPTIQRSVSLYKTRSEERFDHLSG